MTYPSVPQTQFPLHFSTLLCVGLEIFIKATCLRIRVWIVNKITNIWPHDRVISEACHKSVSRSQLGYDREKHRTTPSSWSLLLMAFTLYSSWLWWRAPEPSASLKIAHSKQNGECPTRNRARKSPSKTNSTLCSSEVVNGFTKTQPSGTVLSKLYCQKNRRGKNELAICFHLALHLGELSEKGSRSTCKRRLETLARAQQIEVPALNSCFGALGYGFPPFPKSLNNLRVPLWARAHT